MRVAACLALIGCGRVGFDPRSTSIDDASTGDGIPLADAQGDASTLANGLVVYYPLEGPITNSASDVSGNNHPALCDPGVNCPSGGAVGRIDNAATFDGVSQRLRTPNDPSFVTGSAFTLAVWVLPTDASNTRSIFSKAHNVTATANSWQLELPGTPNIRFKAREMGGGDAEVVGPALALGSWHHVAGSWDGARMRLYVNGTEQGNMALTALVFDTNDLTIGCDVNSNVETGFFEGRIDDVRLYDRALASSEIGLLANP